MEKNIKIVFNNPSSLEINPLKDGYSSLKISFPVTNTVGEIEFNIKKCILDVVENVITKESIITIKEIAI